MNRKLEIVGTEVPEYLKPPAATASPVIVFDSRLPLGPMLRTLAEGGYTIVCDRHGQLVVTSWEWREEFKPAERT